MNASVCQVCGIPLDAGFFDVSSIEPVPKVGEERVLARYQLHRNYCGLLMYFAQFTDLNAARPSAVQTRSLAWQIRCNGRPIEPYLTFDRIINPWGMAGFPIAVRLEEACSVELAVRGVGSEDALTQVGGRLLGRYWYNTNYGGAPNRL
jgi:hypothetical protein